MTTTRKLLATMALVSTLGACTQTIYEKPFASVADFEGDKARCRFQAAAASYSPYNPFVSPVAAGIGQAFDEVRLLKLCLEANGWREQRR